MKLFFQNIDRFKSKVFYSVANQTLALNPYVTDFPKEYFAKIERKANLFQFFKSIFVFFFKMSIKLSIFTLQKIIFSIFWNKNLKVENMIIDTFVLVKQVIENGKYEDNYLKGLYPVLDKKNIKYSYLPRLYGLGFNPLKFIQLLNILKKEDKNFIFEYQLISYLDIFKIHFQIFLYPFQTLSLLQKDDKLFNFHLIQDIAKQDLVAFTRYFIGKKLASFKDIEKIISWSEFQVIERAFNFGYRSNNGNGKISGTQFYLSYPNYFNTFVSEKDNEILSSPHQILVNGKYYLRNSLYKMGVALRYENLFKFEKNSEPRNKILLLTSYLKPETKQMIEFCKGLDLEIKLHPTQKPSDFQIPSNFKLVSGDLYPFFQTSKIVITTGSGTAVEAVAVGVSVIIIESQTNLTSNPLIDFGKGEIWESVKTADEVLVQIQKLSDFRENNPKRISEIAEFYKDNFFIEPTEKTIIQVFNLE